MSPAERIAGFLKEAHPSTPGGTEAIMASPDLFADGWMDSLLHLQLLAWMEKEFGVKVSPWQLSRRSFLTVGEITALIGKQ